MVSPSVTSCKSDPVGLVLDRLRQHGSCVQRSGDGWLACCPAHDDAHPSLSVSRGNDGRCLVHCHAGCGTESIAAAVGLRLADFFPTNGSRPAPEPTATVELLASRKRLPAEFVRGLGVRDGDGRIEIPYRDAAGAEILVRYRSRIGAGDGFSWPKGANPVPYGLDRLTDARGAGYLVLVEGETDSWSGWYHDLPVLGIPGADMTRKIDAAQVQGFDEILLVKEPDKGGETFVRGVRNQLATLAWGGRAKVVSLAPHKDLSDLHVAFAEDPEGFRRAWNLAVLSAVPVELWQEAPKAEAKPAPSRSGRPRVNAGEKDLARQSEATWKALHATNHPPTLFRRGGAIVRIETDDCGRLTARAVDVDRLRHHATDRIEFYSVRKTDKAFEEIPARPPRDLIENLLATPGAKLPILDRIVRAPCYTADATLIERPGFHQGSGILLDLGSLAVPPVPEHPSPNEIRRACETLLVEVLGDFPFLGPADRAAALALLLGPFARALIQGPTPLHVVEKPTPGTGASLMLDCIALIATGGPAAVTTEARDEDEWRKRITSALLGAPAMVLIDNVRNRLDSAALSAAITAEIWNDRRLGQNSIVEIPVTCIWAATGNNPATSSEIARRTIPVRLDAKVDRPWEREARAFRHPSLKAWVAENRGALVHAALTMIRGWIATGCPREDSVTLGSFERWAETMGGILRVAGVPGFLDNLPEFYDRADREGEAHRALVAAWWTRFGDSVVGTAQLFPLVAEEEIPLDLGAGSDRAQKTRFGAELRKLRDRRFGDLKVEVAGVAHKVSMYRLVQDRDRARAGGPGGLGVPSPPRVGAWVPRDAMAGTKGPPGTQGPPRAREPGDDDDEEIRGYP